MENRRPRARDRRTSAEEEQMSRKAKFAVGQVVGFCLLPDSRIGKIVEVHPYIRGFSYLVEICNARPDNWLEEDLRPLTEREIGPKRSKWK